MSDILTILLVLPILGAVVVGALPQKETNLAKGVGLGVAPAKWSFDLGSSPIRRLRALPEEFGDPSHWQFEQTRSPSGHVVSLAIPNPAPDPVAVEWTRLEAPELLAAMA